MGEVVSFKQRSISVDGCDGDVPVLSSGVSLERLCYEFNVMHVCHILVMDRLMIFAVVDVGNILDQCGNDADYVALFYRDDVSDRGALWFSEYLWPNDGERCIYDLMKSEWENELVDFLGGIYGRQNVELVQGASL